MKTNADSVHRDPVRAGSTLVIIYGGIMNSATAIVIFIFIAAESMLEKLDGVKAKCGLVE